LKNIFEARSITKDFHIEGLFGGKKRVVRALDNVSVCMEAGSVMAVVGESGSGKTTFGRCAAGLEIQDSGIILFEGKPVDFKDRETRRKIQYIFQDTYGSLNPRIRAGAAVMEAISHCFGISGKELEAEAFKCLFDVGLSEREFYKYPHELSGGQRQRIVIARALAVKPELLIADEPVSSLDVSVQAQILSLFLGLNRKGISIIFITHDLRIVRALADNVTVFKNGKIVESGPVASVYNRPKDPYSALLISSVPGTGKKR